MSKVARLGSGGFSPVAAISLILVGVLSFAAFLLLTIYEPDLRAGQNPGGHALSRSALGYAGLVRILQDQGVPTGISRTGPGDAAGMSQAADLLVLTPGAGTDYGELAPMISARAGAVLLVLPKWSARRDPEHPGWLRDPRLLGLPTVSRLLEDGKVSRSEEPVTPLLTAAAPLPAKRRLKPAPMDGVQSILGSDYAPLLTDPNGRMLLARHSGLGHLYVLADPDLLNNRGLRSLEGAETAFAIIDGLRGGGAVQFDVSLNGLARQRNPMKLALEPPFLAATLCLLAAALLTAWHAARRFGPARAEAAALALGQRALADNTAGLLALAQREHRMGGRYAALTARLTGLNPEALERRRKLLGLKDSLETLRQVAEAATNRAELVRAARNLHRWRQELTRERR
ncbi:hypothetical protein BKE38_15925 [Pseudoroseomonas deserti]|uniref:DUF4350 domain-containing protein n=1 Tax=Teichococcus deserti TaxID=1817963 RepID=A0A1V2H0Y4_9PROT|nr:DUF4350 domain-containing protein [Pseudoroseomonas deserti]ONG51575.1 hypothetical protein BKE38_15925 [Pseudoroseomonas deserti]